MFKALNDITAASTPSNIHYVAQSETEINISWNLSYDSETGIDFYSIYRNGLAIATSMTPAYLDTGLQPSTYYQYKLTAVNGEGLESLPSVAQWIRTLDPAPLLPGDFDQDDDVDGNDFLAWQRGDSPNSGNALDLAIWKSHSGDTAAALSTATGAVPEPSTALLLVLGFAGWMISRHGSC